MKQANKQAIGAKLRALRLKAGMTQTDVAEYCGCTYKAIQAIEVGRNGVSAERAVQLAQLFRVPRSRFAPHLFGADPHARG